MEIRPIRLDELERFTKIERQAFVMSQDDTEQYMESRYRTYPENTRVLVVEDTIVSQLYIIPTGLWVGGTAPVKMAGIGDVATSPEHRRGGYLKTLLTAVHEELHEQGYAIAVLHPFFYPFYRKFGYELFCTKKQIKVNIKALASFRNRAPAKGRWLPITPSEWATLDAVYQEHCRGHFGRLTRTGPWWEQSVFNAWKNNAHPAYLWQDELGRNRAYIIYSFRPGQGGEREMAIRELVWLDRPAYYEALSFIANHDAQAGKANWYTEENEDIFGLLSDPREAEEHILPDFMLRILDAAQALRERPWPSQVEATFTLALDDDRILRNNDITLQVTVKAGQAQVESRAEKAGAGLSCDIRQLSQLYSGFRSPMQLAELGLLQVHKQQDLEAAQQAFYQLGQPAPFMFDFF
jgi:predicted acetyltransferase